MNNHFKDITWEVIQKTFKGDFVKNGKLDKKLVDDFVDKELKKCLKNK